MPAGIFGLKKIRQVLDDWPELSEFGYFGGGNFPAAPGNVCTIDRLDFSNETTSAPGNNLTEARNSLAAVSN